MDEAKRIGNLRKHGVDFVRVLDFDWETAALVRGHSKTVRRGAVARTGQDRRAIAHAGLYNSIGPNAGDQSS